MNEKVARITRVYDRSRRTISTTVPPSARSVGPFDVPTLGAKRSHDRLAQPDLGCSLAGHAVGPPYSPSVEPQMRCPAHGAGSRHAVSYQTASANQDAPAMGRGVSRRKLRDCFYTTKMSSYGPRPPCLLRLLIARDVRLPAPCAGHPSLFLGAAGSSRREAPRATRGASQSVLGRCR